MKAKLSLSEYTWISAAQYIRWLEVNCDLKPVNVTAVWSMRITERGGGYKGLLKKKKKIEEVISENIDKLGKFRKENDLDGGEEGVILSFVVNLDYALGVLSDQIKTLEGLVRWVQVTGDLEYETIEQGEPPF